MIGGTLTGEPVAVDLGSVLLVMALAIALRAARAGAGPAAHPTGSRMSPFFDRAYRTLLLVMAVSIPVGMALSHLRHG